MSKIKGSISVDVIDTQTVSIDIETLTCRLVSAVINSLDSYYIFLFSLRLFKQAEFKESNNVFAFDSLIPIKNTITKITLYKNFIQLQSK